MITRFRFLFKLLAGFGLIGLIMVGIFLGAHQTLQETAGLLDRAVNVQVRQLAQANRLQSHAHKIRLLEAELPRIIDIFAINGALREINLETQAFSRNLQDFTEEFFSPENEETQRLIQEWQLYLADLERTVGWVQKMNFQEALRTSTYYSRPRFQTFAQTLKEISGQIEKGAQAEYIQTVRHLEYRRRAFLLLSAIGILSGLGFAIFLSRSLSVRLLSLRSAAKRLANGEIGQPLPVAGKDEVADLAEAFNSMRVKIRRREDELRQAQAELEQRVEERTAALAEANRQLQGEIEVRVQAESRLLEANGELDIFATTLSHDLRTPLNLIVSTADFLRITYRDRLDPEGLFFLDEIEKQGERMLKLMEDLLNLARAGELGRPAEPVDTGFVAAQVIESLREPITTAGAKVVLEAMPPLRMPTSLLESIFDNLLGNALHYGCGKSQCHIEVGGYRFGRKVRIFVRDHGPGVPEEERQQIFNIFFRGQEGRNHGGTGIGLATVAKIARIYGGRTWVEETPGGGATFFAEMADPPATCAEAGYVIEATGPSSIPGASAPK